MQGPSTQDKDREFIRHIIDANAEATDYICGFTVEQFLADPMRCRAVTKMVEIAGEAASRVSKEMKATLPEIPWREMADARNKAIHEYFDRDYVIIYSIAVEYLPDVASKLSALEL